jgi:hypothetical protein
MFLRIGPNAHAILLSAFVAVKIRSSRLKSWNSGFLVLVTHLALGSRIL